MFYINSMTISDLIKNMRLESLSAVFLMIFFCLVFFSLGFLISKLISASKIRKIRSDAVKRSRAVLGGQMAEQLAPFLPDFPCNPADCRFVGKPLDFIAFPGAAQNGRIEEILLIEVKTGSSQLSQREKDIRDAVASGKVRYVVYNVK